ncbi:hypothetical protein [Anabaena sphaerica]|nr:hypothetical protein [Anabaena sphaerica]
MQPAFGRTPVLLCDRPIYAGGTAAVVALAGWTLNLGDFRR